MKTLQQLQQQFSQYVRDPESVTVNDVKTQQRMRLYHQLVIGNFSSLLSHAFPVLYNILPHEQWHQLLADFLKNHHATTPLFHEIPQEFVQYLMSGVTFLKDKPYLIELAHYEWVELVLDLANDNIDDTAVDPQGDLTSGIIVFNPVCWRLAYNYTVHTIGSESNLNDIKPQATFLIVYRNVDNNVKFMTIDYYAYQLLESFEKNPENNLKQHIAAMTSISHFSENDMLQQAIILFEQFKQEGIILGVRRGK